ncbi:hypothetical protein [Streptomyces kronopolitis]|uniref:hypothetical protein n=1 Tax=Streptomyces kronopolitis TaxID=1612435 RepID=UPI0036AD17B1
MPSTATETKPPTPTTATTHEPVKQQPKPAAQTREPASAPGQTLAGVLIPGGALTGLIGFCWLSHQFGLPAVLLAVVACSAVATTALVVRAGRRLRRAGSGRLRRASLRAPGTGHRGGSAGPAGRGATGSGRVPAARSGAGPSLRKPPSSTSSAVGRAGGTSRKPGGLAAKPKPLGAATPNLAGRQPGALGRGAAALGGPGRRTTPGGAAPRTAPKPTGGASLRKHTGGGAAPMLSGTAGRLARTFSRKSPTTAAGGNTPQGGARRAGGAMQPKGGGRQQPGSGKGGFKPAPQQSATSAGGRARKAAKALTQAALRNRGQSGKEPSPGKLKARSKRTLRQGKFKVRGAWSGVRRGSRLTKQGSYWVGRKLRQHLSPVTRDRLSKAATPLRVTARLVARHGSPLLAHAWRYGARALLNGHLALGSVRFSTVGPNWLRPLARVFHTLTTPAARALAWAGTWGWLNRWMYRHTGGGTTASPPKTCRTAQAGGRTAGGHRPVHSPTRITTPATKGVPVGSIEPALPLQYAADAVRTAGAMMVLNPAGNMVGYEATINSLAEIQRAIGDVISMAAHSSRENFKVNAAIPEAYDDTAVYAHALAGRLDSIPTLYRIIHAEQIDNIENPTVQGAKWDQSANWQ